MTEREAIAELAKMVSWLAYQACLTRDAAHGRDIDRRAKMIATEFAEDDCGE